MLCFKFCNGKRIAEIRRLTAIRRAIETPVSAIASESPMLRSRKWPIPSWNVMADNRSVKICVKLSSVPFVVCAGAARVMIKNIPSKQANAIRHVDVGTSVCSLLRGALFDGVVEALLFVVSVSSFTERLLVSAGWIKSKSVCRSLIEWAVQVEGSFQSREMGGLVKKHSLIV